MLGAERNTQIPSQARGTAPSNRRRSWIKKTALPALVLTVLFIGMSITFFFDAPVPQARADNVSTSLQVLNTPPGWTVIAQEATQSSTSTPTNAGATLSFTATATDSSNDNYWLIICSASSTPTAHISAAPTCGAGIQWAVSGVTVSGTQAIASTTTIPMSPFLNESNPWYGYVCDGNATGPQCNKVVEQGSGTTASPFVINHPPIFTAIVNDGPKNPGQSVTWTATASDTDTIRGGDTLSLYVCKANDFATSTGCGAGGTWASISGASSNPATSTLLAIPTQDATYSAYVYIEDNNSLAATSSIEATNSSFVVNSVAPSIDPASISLVDPATASSTTYLTLTHPQSYSGPYYVKFSVTDNNGCQNISSGHEISLATTSIYRSGIGQSACDVAGNFNSNSCYPSASALASTTCTQDTSGALTGNACSGPSDSSVGWVCTFSLWYNADATVPSTAFAAQNWLASTQAQAFNGLLSPLVESSVGNEVDSFLAFGVTQTSISYGGLQPGQSNDPLATTTNLIAEGNVGLDESLYGDTMCTTWSGPDSCDTGGPDATKKIPVANQHLATSSVAFASGTALTGSTTPTSLALHLPKTTATSSPQSANTYWGISVPGTITTAGNYNGQNTITAVTSNSAYW